MRISTEVPKVPEAGLNHLPFRHFIEKVYPIVREQPEIIDIVSGILIGLQPLCIEQNKGVFAYVKKGAMREFSLDTGEVQKDLIATFGKLRPHQIGESKEIQKIVEDNFSGPMDLDIRLARHNPEDKISVYKSIFSALEQFGFHQTEDNDNNSVMYSGSLKAQIYAFPIDIKTGRTKWAIDIFNLTDTKAIFKLDIIDFPQNNDELHSDVTDTLFASDIDQVLGYISNHSGNLDLYYEEENGKPRIHSLLENNYLGTSFASGLSTSIQQNLFRGAREAGQRAMFTLPLFEHWPFMTMQELIELKRPRSKEQDYKFPLKNMVVPWIQQLQDYLKASHSYLMSCQIGMASGNIAIGLPFYWLNEYANLTPFGRLIQTRAEFEQCMNFMLEGFGLSIDTYLSYIATAYNEVLKQHDADNLGALLLIDALKKMGKIPQNTPRTLTTTAELLDPLRLIGY